MKLPKTSLLGVAAATLGFVLIAASFGNNPAFAAINFKSGPSCGITGSHQLECTGRVTGLGNTATATLTAQATVTQGCVNRGSQGQQPSGLQRTSQSVVVTEPLAVHNGGANFDLVSSPITPTISCPDHMTPVVVCVTYTGITVRIDSSTGTTGPVPGNPSTVSDCPTA